MLFNELTALPQIYKNDLINSININSHLADFERLMDCFDAKTKRGIGLFTDNAEVVCNMRVPETAVGSSIDFESYFAEMVRVHGQEAFRQNEVQAVNCTYTGNILSFVPIVILDVHKGTWLVADEGCKNTVNILHAMTKMLCEQMVYQSTTKLFTRMLDIDNNLASISNNNGITKLPDKDMFIEYLDSSFKNENFGGVVALINIDSFKSINEAYGREQGNKFLSVIADFIKSVLDTNDKVFHLYADEFIVVLDSVEKAKSVLVEIKEKFLQVWHVGEYDHFRTLSIGAVIFPKDGQDGETLLKNADIAVSLAKSKGKNNIVYYKKNEDRKISQRLRKELMLRQAIESENEIDAYFQPLINTATGECIGAEALARWIHPVEGMISPAEFIPMAERISLINAMGEKVLYISCEQCKIWQKEAYPNISISVNLSISQLYEKNYSHKVRQILDETGLDPIFLTFEITENIAMNDLRKTTMCLNELRDIGVSIALDDFGKGYSSLNVLRVLPLDYLKIDRSFISNISKDNFQYLFTKTILELAKSINLKVCCEGIEYLEQWEILKKLKSDTLQGYYFGKPVSGTEFLRRLLAKK